MPEISWDSRVRRNYRPITGNNLRYAGAGARAAGIALWPNGEQALANCQRLIDMARHFERGADHSAPSSRRDKG